MNKRAISSIVATVLIIFGAVVLSTILFFGVKTMISGLNEINTDVDLQIITSEGYTLWDEENRLATIQVKRGDDNSDLVGFDMVFTFEGDSVKHYVTDIPGTNSKKVYAISFFEFTGSLDSVKIIPVFSDGSLGSVAAELDVTEFYDQNILDLIDEGKLDEEDFVEPSGISGSSSSSSGGGSSSSSSSSTTTETTCGDGVIEGSEACDYSGSELLFGSRTCKSEGALAGDLFCNDDCSLDITECIFNCETCASCDEIYDPCTYYECHSECPTGDCYYRGYSAIRDDCVNLTEACEDELDNCTDYSEEECPGDPCGFGGCHFDEDAGECVSGEASETCTPIDDPCGERVCGTVGNGTCGMVSCGSCDSGEYCDYSLGGCVGENDDFEWTIPVPTEYDISSYSLTSLSQPGSRIFYISSSEGNDSTAMIYFWNGTHLIDELGSAVDENGDFYGTDPMNPSGEVKSFARWSIVAPRRWGQDINSSWTLSYDSPGSANVETRYEYPDWWMFKRGDTFNMGEDFLSFAQDWNSSTTMTGGGLAVSGGRSETERQIVGAYGDLSEERPILMNISSSSLINRWNDPEPKHIAYLSLHVNGRGEDRMGGFTFMYQSNESIDILFEDMLFEGTSTNVIQNTDMEITFRRCVIVDAYKDSHTSHTQGLYLSPGRDAKINFHECYFMRNGFSYGDPSLEWPPVDEQIYDVYNRNMYFSGECNNMESGLFDSISLVGASGDQYRLGMRIERNFFYQGYVAVGAYGGYPDSEGATGSILDNVIQKYQGYNTDDNRGQPGWGLSLTSGAYDVDVARNIVTGAQNGGWDYAFLLEPLNWYTYSHIFHYATRNNRIYDNIFDGGNYERTIKVVDGVDAEDVEESLWVYPGVVNNSFYNNTIINIEGQEWEYVTKDIADGTTTDTEFIDNDVYLTRDEAAAALGGTDPNRTLKTYMESLGYTIDSDDGYPEFFDEAIQQRRGYWREEYTSHPIINYFREGFGMELLD